MIKKIIAIGLVLLSVMAIANETVLKDKTPSAVSESTTKHIEEKETTTNFDNEGMLTTLEHLKQTTKTTDLSEENPFSDNLNKELEKQNKFLGDLLKSIQSDQTIPTPDIKDEIFQLTQKMNANKSYGYYTAYQRDRIKSKTLSNELVFISSINSLIYQRLNFTDKETIQKTIKGFITNLKNSPEIKSIAQDYEKYSEGEGDVTEELKKNYIEYKNNINLYLVVYEYLLSNIDAIHKTNLISQNLSFEYWAEKVNQQEFANEINYYLNYIQTDLGRLVFAIVALILINSLRIFVLPIAVAMIKKGFTSVKETDGSDVRMKHYIVKSISSPIKITLWILSIQMAVNIIHNGQFNIDLWQNTFNSLYAITLALAVFNLMNEWLNLYSATFFSNYPHIRKEMISFFIKFAKISLATLVLIYSLYIFGFNVQTIIASLGVGGIAVALAAKDSLTNIFGGISIMLDDSLRQGDWIVSGDVEGTVVEIRLRTTTIRTFDNAFITVPNSEIASRPIKNWNRREVGRRIKMSVGVTYESNMEDVKNAINDIRNMLYHHDGIAVDERVNYNIHNHNKLTTLDDEHGIKKTLLVHLTDFNSSSMDIQVYCFSTTVNWEEWLNVRQDVMFKIAEIIENNNLEFAYPTMVNWVKGDMSNPLQLENRNSNIYPV